MKVAIIDDEASAITLLKDMISMLPMDITICGSAQNTQSALQLIETAQPDLLLLDIMLGSESGFGLLDKLSPSQHYQLVFTTAYSDYAIRAIQYGALDYLLKPISFDSLQKVMQKSYTNYLHYQQKQTEVELLRQQIEIIRHINQEEKPTQRIAIRLLEGIKIIEFDQIITIHGQGNYSIFHLTGGEDVISSRPLSFYTQILPDKHFYRAHKSYIINLLHLLEIRKKDGFQALLHKSITVPISRRAYSELVRKISLM